MKQNALKGVKSDKCDVVLKNCPVLEKVQCENGFRYNLPEKGVAVSPFRYYYWMLFVMTNNFCCGAPIRNGLPVEKKTKTYFRYI